MNLIQESAHFIVSNQNSNYCYFLFSGDNATKKRIVNFIHNYGVTTGAVEQYNEEYHYCMAPFDRLQDKLLELFKNETILERENIDYMVSVDEDGCVSDITWCNQKVFGIAKNKLADFMAKVEFSCKFQVYERATAYNEHGVGIYQDAEPEMLTA